MATPDADRCEAHNKAGRRCGWPARFADGKCHVHSTTAEGVAMRQAVNLLSANSTRRPAALSTLDDAVQYAAWAANEFARGRMDEKKLAAVDRLLERFALLVKARDQDAKFAEMQRMLEEAKALKAAKAKP